MQTIIQQHAFGERNFGVAAPIVFDVVPFSEASKGLASLGLDPRKQRRVMARETSQAGWRLLALRV